MNITQALSKWTEACTVEQLKGTFVRNGNWQPIARALRHHKDESSSITEAGDTLNGDAIICVVKGEAKALLVVK